MSFTVGARSTRSPHVHCEASDPLKSTTKSGSVASSIEQKLQPEFWMAAEDAERRKRGMTVTRQSGRFIIALPRNLLPNRVLLWMRSVAEKPRRSFLFLGCSDAVLENRYLQDLGKTFSSRDFYPSRTHDRRPIKLKT